MEYTEKWDEDMTQAILKQGIFCSFFNSHNLSLLVRLGKKASVKNIKVCINISYYIFVEQAT